MLIENSSCICQCVWYTYCKTHDIRVICPKNQNVFTLTGVLTMSNLPYRPINKCLHYDTYERMSNAISNADKSFLQHIDLGKTLGEAELFHDTYEMKYMVEHETDGSPRILRIQPAGTFENPGIIISKDDFIRGAIIAEAFIIHSIFMIHVVRPPQSGKTALVWAVEYHTKELVRKLKHKSLFLYMCIQKGLNELQLDIQKDLVKFGESDEFVKIKHLLNYRKSITSLILDDCQNDDNFHLVVFDEIQIAHNQNGNADEMLQAIEKPIVNRRKKPEEKD